MGRLDGKVVIITGAGSGIGRAAARIFAGEGAAVFIAELDEDAGQSTADLITQDGGDAHFQRTDITDEDSVRRCIDETVRVYGRLTTLYNNAGGSTANDGTVETAPLSEFRRAIELELFGTWLMRRHAIPELRKSSGAAIVNVSSTVAFTGFPGKDAYTAAKGAVTALTRSMAVEFAADGIRVNAICPGLTLTDRVRQQLGELSSMQDVQKRFLLGPCEPEDQAWAALYLASDEARVTTGQVLRIDSGYTIS